MKTVKLFILSLLALTFLTCERQKANDEPVFIFQSPKVLFKNLIANNLIVPRFSPDGLDLIFNGRIDGDLWDGIYQIPIVGGLPQKIYSTTDDILYPSYSADQRQVIFSQGLARQIYLLDIVTKNVTPLPIYGNYPTILPDGSTILYTGGLDGNIRLYDLRENRHRVLTKSHSGINIFPMMTQDRVGFIWLENRKPEQVRVNQTDFDALKTKILQIFAEPLLSWTISPSGEWAIASRPNGEPFGFKLYDTAFASISIQPDTLVKNVKHLAFSVDWSPTGRNVVYVGNTVPQFSRENPFTYRGIFKGDLVISNLRWENIEEAELLKSPAVSNWTIFPYSEPNIQGSPRFVPTNINNPPVITSVPVETARQGELYFYRVQAVEIDLFDKITYSVVSGPENATILKNTGILVWQPIDSGRFEFTVAVQDNYDGIDSQTFYVDVLPAKKGDDIFYQSQPVDKKASGFAASLSFRDSDGDGFLMPGEEAALQIDLKPLYAEKLDSVRLQLLCSAESREVSYDRELIFKDCQPNQWNQMIVPIKALPKLQNRSIVFWGIIETKYGFQILPASLIINGKNPEKNI